MNYSGKLYWDGESPKIQTKDKFVEWLKQFPEDRWFTIDVKPLGNLNVSNQSKLYHKWCDILAEEYGWDSGDDMHQFLKKTYNNSESTKGMDTKQWSTYMTKVLSFASENNITLPTGLS